MLILLPPSETKRVGGEGPALALDGLALPSLHAVREDVVAALVALSARPDDAARVLKLGPRQRDQIAVNAGLRSAATMPAMDRYTGVLFDALDPGTLGDAERAWLGRHALIHTAPFGPVGVLDGIPSYRLAAGASLPGVPPLRRAWAPAVTEALAGVDAPFVLDLRSEAYVALGPVPPAAASAYIRVVSDDGSGTGARALNHFNKRAKGELVRALARDAPVIASGEDLLAWGAAARVDLRRTPDPRVWHLVV
ncbi:YaaA family protein [Microbacterium sp. NPDC078428]|uniref:YaaA family protein n=1 Tax=Microbacterium sp. NPDC078428 TaxID=3364190 RepID=UPI0037CA02D4